LFGVYLCVLCTDTDISKSYCTVLTASSLVVYYKQDHGYVFRSELVILKPIPAVTLNIQGDQKVSVRLMNTIQKVTSNVQSVPRQSPDIY
jgi:hypothetical protein